MADHPSNVPFPELFLDYLVGNQDQDTDQGHRSQRFPHFPTLPSFVATGRINPGGMRPVSGTDVSRCRRAFISQIETGYELEGSVRFLKRSRESD